MISKEDFKNLVDLVAQKTGKTQEELAVEMGYGKNYISELTTPSGTVSKKFLQAFKLRHRDILENPKNGTTRALAEDVPTLESTDNATLLRILDNLSAAHREISESNNKLADNEKLILMQMPTVGSAKDNGIASPAIMSGILVAMAKIGSGKKWHSEDEALRELGKLLSPQVDESKKTKDTRVG